MIDADTEEIIKSRMKATLESLTAAYDLHGYVGIVLQQGCESYSAVFTVERRKNTSIIGHTIIEAVNPHEFANRLWHEYRGVGLISDKDSASQFREENKIPDLRNSANFGYYVGKDGLIDVYVEEF